MTSLGIEHAPGDSLSLTEHAKVPADILDALPADEDRVEADEHTFLGVAELLLKAPGRLDTLSRNPTLQAQLIPRLLAIALAGFSIFAVSLVLLLQAAPAEALPELLRVQGSPQACARAVSLWLAYTLGLVAATGICLPSFYFHGLLAGVNLTVLQATTHIMKGKASTAVMLIGVLPVYVSGVLGLMVFGAPEPWLKLALYLGLALPFLAGIWGVHSIYTSFLRLADTLPPHCRCARECFLRRLTVACAACYSAVTPVMICTLWNYFMHTLA